MTPEVARIRLKKRREESSPVGFAHDWPPALSKTDQHHFQSKGFLGGVPRTPFDKLRVRPEQGAKRAVDGLNTETTAVKPRVGIEQITKRCLFFVEMARAGSVRTLTALHFPAAVA